MLFMPEEDHVVKQDSVAQEEILLALFKSIDSTTSPMTSLKDPATVTLPAILWETVVQTTSRHVNVSSEWFLF